MKLEALMSAIPEAVIQGNPELEIEHLEYDSRAVRPNTLFMAITGFAKDGYDFVEDAKKNGAIAVMGERKSFDKIDTHVSVPNARKAMADVAAHFYDYPGTQLKAIGVTGTNGKTTTSHLIRRMLEARNKKTGLITSTVYDTGGETFKAERTTPESLDVQRLLYLMKRNLCVNAVIEVSSHALVLHRVDNINFRVAVFTNFTRDHLDFHKTMEAYLDAKAMLLKKLDGEWSYAVINLDVPEFRRFFGELNSAYMSYSLSDDHADVFCSSFELKQDRTVFDLVTPMGTKTVVFQLPGRFNLQNAVAAAAGGLAAGVDLEHVVIGLESARPVPGRLNTAQAGQPFGIYIDYAHTPDAIMRLCQTVRELSTGRLLLLFGCGGDRDRGKRPLMGEVATTNADFAIVTSDNPRTEDPLAIIEEIKPGLKGSAYTIIPDRKAAIHTIISMAKPGDTVLLAGKGAEDYQEIHHVKHPFSDRGEAFAVLEELGYTAVQEER